ncbi:hypothetical protein R5H30_15935 [Sulfitobacter sp. D35]|nr:hypothetical protein [Sulfitobacter sp. D35]
MLHALRKFRDEDSGAVTVDWVVLTAAVVGLALLVVSEISDAVVDPSTSIASFLTGWTF